MDATLDFLCGECLGHTSFTAHVELGNNSVDIPCSQCGEQWHVLFQVLSFDPLLLGDWLIKRLLGVAKGNTFFSKQQLQ